MASCTLPPCLNRQCVSTTADASGDFRKDLVGQWVSSEGVDSFVEYRADGTGRRVVVCDNGTPGVTPGSVSTFSYTLDGGTLNEGSIVYELISVSGAELVIRSVITDGATVKYNRSSCTGSPF